MARLNTLLTLAAASLISLGLYNWSSLSRVWAPLPTAEKLLPGFDMVKVEKGNYGLTILVPNSLGFKYHSKPVEIKTSFAVAKHEVTIDQWNLCFKDGGCAHKAKQRRYQKGDHPVTLVSWFDAMSFTKWLSKKTGASYRLPTEEEWAYMAFTGKDVTKATINGLIKERKEKRVASMTRFRKTQKVGTNGANKWAVADTKGSVWEWTMTCWFSSDEENKRSWTIAQLQDHSLCPNRVVQGQERGHVPVFINEVYTGGCGTGAPIDHIGFRVVRELSS